MVNERGARIGKNRFRKPFLNLELKEEGSGLWMRKIQDLGLGEEDLELMLS